MRRATLHSRDTQGPSVFVKQEPPAGDIGEESQCPMYYVAGKMGVPQGPQNRVH